MNSPLDSANRATRESPDQRLQQDVIGSLLAGHLRIVDLLGTGGMSAVYEAYDTLFNETVAVKLLLPGIASSKKHVRRFKQENQTISKLRHPHIVQVLESGLTESDCPYMVMELVRGNTLTSLLAERNTLPIGLTVDLMIQIASALDHAHANRVIHRDLKPSNIMLVEQPDGGYSTRIVDFGIAKILSDKINPEQKITQTGEILGSPTYMSPEQGLSEKHVDERSDIYSLGCVMYECLTGLPPHFGDSAVQVLVLRQTSPVLTLREATLGKQFPLPMERIVRRMLRKLPDERYQSAADLLTDLNAFRLAWTDSWQEEHDNANNSFGTTEGALNEVGVATENAKSDSNSNSAPKYSDATSEGEHYSGLDEPLFLDDSVYELLNHDYGRPTVYSISQDLDTETAPVRHVDAKFARSVAPTTLISNNKPTRASFSDLCENIVDFLNEKSEALGRVFNRDYAVSIGSIGLWSAWRIWCEANNFTFAHLAINKVLPCVFLTLVVTALFAALVTRSKLSSRTKLLTKSFVLISSLIVCNQLITNHEAREYLTEIRENAKHGAYTANESLFAALRGQKLDTSEEASFSILEAADLSGQTLFRVAITDLKESADSLEAKDNLFAASKTRNALAHVLKDNDQVTEAIQAELQSLEMARTFPDFDQRSARFITSTKFDNDLASNRLFLLRLYVNANYQTKFDELHKSIEADLGKLNVEQRHLFDLITKEAALKKEESKKTEAKVRTTNQHSSSAAPSKHKKRSK